MLSILKKPGKRPQMFFCDNELKALQDVVGGYIETMSFGDLIVICNEEGLINHLHYNCTIDGYMFFGDILVVGRDEDEFAPLKAAQLKRAIALVSE